jgi:spermidine synthase
MSFAMIRKGIPGKFYFFCALIGLGISMALFGYFKQLCLLFGFHMVSVVTILVALFLNLAMGSRILGKIADKLKAPLKLLVVLSVSSFLSILFAPITLKYLGLLYIKILHLRNSGLFEMGMIRFIFVFVFLIFPFALISGMIPVLIRSFIRNISYSGRYMSASILSLSAGAMAGILLVIMLILPLWGFHSIFYVSAALFFFLGVFTIQYIYIGAIKIPYPVVSKSEPSKTLRFRKKKPILEAGRKLTKAMLYGYSFQSFTFSAMILISIRILFRYSPFQSDLFYALILVIVLTGIMAGTSLYHVIAEKPVNKYMALATFQIISGMGSLISYAFLIVFANSVSGYINEPSSLSELLTKQVLLFSVFLFIPAFIHGMSFPLAGKLYPKRIQLVGKSFGHLCSLLFLNLMSGIVIAPFILVPLLGLHLSYFFLSLLMVFSGIFLIFRDSRLIRGYRMGYAFTGIILFLLVTGIFRNLNLKHYEQTVDKKAEGSSASVKVIENKDKSRSVFINGVFSFGTDPYSRKEQVLSACIPLFINQHIRSALITGFGTGLTASALDQYHIPDIRIAEIYPEIIRVSSDVFADENNDILTGSSVNITIEDPRSYIFKTSLQYDLITSGINQIALRELYSRDFYKLCLDKLTPTGLFCQVVPVKSISKKEFLAICQAASSIFDHVSLWYLSPDNLMLLGSREELHIDLCRLSSSFTALKAGLSFANLHIQNQEQLLAHLLIKDREITTLTGNVRAKTDNNPYMAPFPVYKKDEQDILAMLQKVSGNYIRDIRFSKDCQADTLKIRNQIRHFNQSLFQQSSLSSVILKPEPVDFFEWISLPFQQYL